MAVVPEAVPQLSVVIPCLRHAEELAHCLEGLQAQDRAPAFEVIVVDSGQDPAAQETARRFAGVNLIRPTQLLSVGAARNLGAAHARAQVLGFLDADCIPARSWVKAALEAVEAGARIAGGPILDVLPWHLVAASDNRLQFVDFPPRRPAGSHPYLPGAHMAMPRAVFEGSGGFDPTIMLAEDVLFSEPVAKASAGAVWFEPRMIVRHWGRRSWGEFLRHQYAFGYSRAENKLRMDRSWRWLGLHPGLAWAIVLRRLLYISLRVLQWNLPDLPRFILQLPMIAIGLSAWTRGFYAGMHTDATTE